MKIFLTYASEQKSIAEAIAFSLRSRNFQVFLDKDDLPPGRSYDEQIETAIEDSDYLLFLISPESVKPGRYTLTELELARRKWRTPDGSVLPVLVAPTPMSAVPQFLRAVTILEPQGNIAAEVAAHVKQTDRVASRNLIAYFAAAGLISGLLSDAAIDLPGAMALNGVGGPASIYPGIYFGLGLCALFYVFLRVPIAALALVLVIVQLSWQLAVSTAWQFGTEVQFREHQAASITDGSGSGDAQPAATREESPVTSTVPPFDRGLFFPGLFGGIVGAVGTWIATAIAVGKARTLECALLTAVAGGILGILMGFHTIPWLTYMSWQSAVAASLAYNMARAR